MINKRTLITGLAAAFIVSGCTVTDAYSTAATANDVSLEAAAMKLCSPISTIAAQRNWTVNQQTARDLFCAERVKE